MILLNKSAGHMVLALVAGFLLLFPPRAVRAAEEPFPLYPAIESNVRFWEKVFAEYSLSQGILHDRDDLSIIYAVVEVLPPKPAQIRPWASMMTGSGMCEKWPLALFSRARSPW